MTAPAVTSFTPAGGPTAGGTVITVTGTTLTSPTGYTVDGTAFTAGIAGVDSTHVTIVMPSAVAAGATPGTAVAVEVTTAGGTSSNGILYQYFDPSFKTNGSAAPAPHPDTKRSQRGYFNLGPSYTTGGLVIPPGLLGFTYIDEVIACSSLVGRPCAWVPNSTGGGGKLKVFAASDTEVASGVDLHADSVYLIAWGK